MRFQAAPEEVGCRLDAFLASKLSASGVAGAGAAFTRSRVQKLIEQGRARLDGARAKASARVRAGAVAEIELPEPRVLSLVPEEIPLAILFEDPELIVIDKPAGLAVHPGAGRPRGTLVNALLARGRLPRIGDALRPGIVHRLDKDTSGVIVVAKTDAAFQSLVGQFQRRTIGRVYRALVWGHPPESGTVDAPLARDPRDRKRFAVAPEGGKRAVTRFRTVARFSLATEVECRLETGRTHQIRVHLSHAGFPLVGDPLYGRRAPREAPAEARRASRQMLHAESLSFEHPVTGERVSFHSPLPEDYRQVREALAS